MNAYQYPQISSWILLKIKLSFPLLSQLNTRSKVNVNSISTIQLQQRKHQSSTMATIHCYTSSINPTFSFFSNPKYPSTKTSPPFPKLFTLSAPCSPQFRLNSLAVDSATLNPVEKDGKKLLLEVNDLTAVIAESQQTILNGVSLTVYEGEVHAIMGKNGSGKSTFSKVLVGHPDYEVTGGTMTFKGQNLLEMDPEERSLSGIFMSFQSPVAIPGVSNADFLNMAYNARQRKLGLPELGPIEFFSHVYSKLDLVNMKMDFLNRNVNEGFSGGERKRNEILQLAVLGADLAILDEIDSGLDIDALQDVAKAVNGLLTPNNSVLMITHYQRLLEYIKPAYIHIMEDGRIVRTGDISLASILEKEGYKGITV